MSDNTQIKAAANIRFAAMLCLLTKQQSAFEQHLFPATSPMGTLRRCKQRNVSWLSHINFARRRCWEEIENELCDIK